MRSLVKYGLTAALMIVVAFLGLEALVRVRTYIKYGGDGPHQFEVDSVTGLRLPKVGKNSRTVWINPLGFRSPELANPKPKGTIRVAFLGSSTTFCAEVSGNDATWPHLVWSQLKQRYPQAKFDYVNAGVVGFTLESTRKNLEMRVKPLKPDVIVIYEGINDIVTDTRKIAESQGLPSGRLGEPAGLEKYSRAWSMAKTLFMLRRRSQAPAAAAKRIRLEDHMLVEQGFRGRYEKLVDSAKSIAPVVGLVTISVKARRDQSPEEQQKAAEWSLYYMPYMTPAAILQGFEYYNREIRALAKEKDAALLDGEETIPGDAAQFFDSVHFTDLGARTMAQRVTERLVATPAFQRTLEAAAVH